MVGNYFGSIVELKTSKQDELLATGRIVRVAGKEMVIRVLDGEYMHRPPRLWTINLQIHTNARNSILLDGEVFLATSEYIRVVGLRNERHICEASFRVRLDVDGGICNIFDQQQQYSRAIMGPVRKVYVMDMSAKDVRICCNSILEVGQRFILRFTAVFGEVGYCLEVASAQPAPETPRYYVCSFFDLMERETDLLLEALYELSQPE